MYYPPGSWTSILQIFSYLMLEKNPYKVVAVLPTLQMRKMRQRHEITFKQQSQARLSWSKTSLPKEESNALCRGLSWITGKDSEAEVRTVYTRASPGQGRPEFCISNIWQWWCWWCGPRTTCLSRRPYPATTAINSQTVLHEGEAGLIRLISWVHGHQHRT